MNLVRIIGRGTRHFERTYPQSIGRRREYSDAKGGREEMGFWFQEGSFPTYILFESLDERMQ